MPGEVLQMGADNVRVDSGKGGLTGQTTEHMLREIVGEFMIKTLIIIMVIFPKTTIHCTDVLVHNILIMLEKGGHRR